MCNRARLSLRCRTGALVIAAMLLPAEHVSAQAFAGMMIGRADGETFANARTDVTLNAGLWVLEWVAAEVRSDSVLGAFAVNGNPDQVPRSSISILGLDLAVAPVGQVGRARPFAAVGIGRARTIIDSDRGAYRSANRTTSAAAGVVAGTDDLWWRAEIRRTVFAGSFPEVPGLTLTRPAFWGVSTGVAFVFGASHR